MSYYDLDARTVECNHCGAPLTSPDQGVATCEYCGTENEIRRRARDGRPAPTPVEEIARLANLKNQLVNPVSGHAYDMEGVPPTLAVRGVVTRDGTKLSKLDELWPEVRREAGRGLEEQRALVWVAIRSAELLEAVGRSDAARAKLETALDHLPDPGHRQLVRAQLALNAIRHRELDAAAGWLGECDSAPEVLELDSVHRYVSARLAVSRKDASSALRLLGMHPDEVPMSGQLRGVALLTRIAALEAAGKMREAQRQWDAEASNDARMLVVARREGLAVRSRLRSSRRQYDELLSHKHWATRLANMIAGTMGLLPIVALPLAIMFSLEGCATKRGPLLGSSAHIVCPMVCADCTAPVTYFYFSRNGQAAHEVYCDTPASRTSQMGWMDLAGRTGAAQAVPGGGFTMFVLTYLLVMPLALLVALALVSRWRKRRRASWPRRAPLLAAAVADIEAAGEVPRAHRVKWPRILTFAATPFAAAGLILVLVLAE